MKLKKHILATFVALLMMTPYQQQQAQAKNNIGSQMNAMWNTTMPGFNGEGVNGAYGGHLGGINVRTPVSSINIVSFDPPHFDAGCGGIDAYFGSFSLISTDNIKQALKAIISNAAGYAIQLALDNVCHSCSEIAGKFQDLTQKVSIDSLNTCQIGTAAVDWIRGAKNAGERNSEAETENLEHALASGKEDDLHSSRMANTDGKTNRRDNADELDTKYGNNLLNTYISAGIFDSVDTSVFGSKEKFFNIAMSLIGTNVMTTGSNKKESDYYVEAIWNFQHLIDGTATGGDLTVLSCGDGFSSTNSSKCQNVKHKTNKWLGTKRHVLDLLIGEQKSFSGNDSVATEIKPDSIIAHIRDPKGVQLDETRRQFYNALSPEDTLILSHIAKLNDQAIISSSNSIANLYSKELAAHLAKAIVQETRRAYSTRTNKKKAELSINQKAALEKLEYDYKQVEKDQLQEREILKNIITELSKLS